VTIAESIEFDGPVSTAYNQWTQFESFPQFTNGVESITQSDDTHTHWMVTAGGTSREFDAEITEQHPDERVAWKSTDGTTHAGVVTFHKLSDSASKVMVQLDWMPNGIVEKVGAAIGVDDCRVKADLRKFKQLIEAKGEAGGWRGEVPR
jgi:uncharacterized membrane protein